MNAKVYKKFMSKEMATLRMLTGEPNMLKIKGCFYDYDQDLDMIP